MKSIELFAGAGGLAFGASLAGFRPEILVERDKWACDTIRQNIERGYPVVQHWPLTQGDVREISWDTFSGKIDLLAGGPPCQPFSMGGKHRAHDDGRDMFPATVDILRRVQPKAFLIENVKGLTRTRFENYFQYILLQLEFPEVVSRKNEDWFRHFQRLQSEKSAGNHSNFGLSYQVLPTLANAADYGVPQRRERVFIVGFRSDLGIEWSFPSPTHSAESLLMAQWLSGEYWERHKIAKKHRPTPPAGIDKKLVRLATMDLFSERRPWRTVRDALWDLPSPDSKAALRFHNHVYQDGARVYPGHTGSPMDAPAKTLKAGDHGVPGGENMMVLDDGRVRYFTVRESARLQTFPDGYVFHGSWTETMRQLGNAVPVALARSIAASMLTRLASAAMSKTAQRTRKGVA